MAPLAGPGACTGAGVLASEAPTTQHSLPVPVLLSAQPREQFSFLSVGTGGTLRPSFGGNADVGPACSLPSSAAPLLRGGLRAEALLTPEGLEEGPVLPTAPAVQSWGPRWPPCPAGHAEVVSTEQAKRGRCPEAGPGGRQAAQAGTALATRPARGPATGALGPKKDRGQRASGGPWERWQPGCPLCCKGGSRASKALPLPSDQPFPKAAWPPLPALPGWAAPSTLLTHPGRATMSGPGGDLRNTLWPLLPPGHPAGRPLPHTYCVCRGQEGQ